MIMPINSVVPQKQTFAVANAIAEAASKTGVEFDYLFNQARVESALNPSAKAKTSSASGLFQFTNQTWLATVKEHGAAHGMGWAADAISKGADGKFRVGTADLGRSILGLRYDADASSAMAAELALDNRDFLAGRLGREVPAVDLYLAHFLGAGGAAKFLSAHDTAPDQPAAPLFPAAAAANRSIFYNGDGSARSLADIRNGFAAKMEGQTPQPQRTHFETTIQSKSQPMKPLPMRDFETMPGKLSLAFAQAAYARVAADRAA
jgi:hypothetical protein